MSSKNKQQTTQTQNQASNTINAYDWETPPDTADIANMRNFQFTSDPRVGYSYSRARGNLKESFNNPLGANTTSSLRDAMLRAGYEDLGQQEAQANAEENYAHQGLEYGKRADVAQMTQPRLVQKSQSGSSSGTSNSNTVQQPSMLPSLISGGSAVGQALLM